MPTVEQTTQINTSADEVWRLAGDPARIADWLPALESSTVEGDRRSCALQQGGQIEERILEHSDDDRRYRYEILDGPMPLRSYVSTFSVEDDADRSRVSWIAEFEPEDPAEEQELVGTFEQIYSQGLASLKETLEGTRR